MKQDTFNFVKEDCAILTGDCLTTLALLPGDSANCCVTSPPYYNLRNYDNDNQIGMESSPEEYIDNLVKVFREVKRVLKDDGTLWLNLGDTYRRDKNLLGIPWRVAFALQQDGWYLRQDIIWHKPNPMPEAVNDRCAKSHEHIFLFSKKKQYYFDADAIRTETKARMRDVWSINTASFGGAHFAVFPDKLPELCIKAGTKEGDIVFDPFMGSGTTAQVAQRLSRKWVGIELNPEYAKIINGKTAQRELF